MSKPIISFKNVSKEYTLYKSDQERFKALFFKNKNAKINKALKNVSFDIMPGESVGLIGDNGAGKSTILKLITGVAYPSEGEISVEGKVAALLEHLSKFEDGVAEVATLHEYDVVVACQGLCDTSADMLLVGIEITAVQHLARQAGSEQRAIEVALVVGSQDEGPL